MTKLIRGAVECSSLERARSLVGVSLTLIALAVALGACSLVVPSSKRTEDYKPGDASIDGTSLDAGQLDAGRDALVADARVDLGDTPDSGEVDAGEVDAGDVDAGDVDGGAIDAGFDAGDVDAGAIDAGFDAGVDAGMRDLGVDSCVPVSGHLDADGDGRGRLALTMGCAGSVPTPLVASSDDCDDMRADVYPGAPEACNGVDNDCDGVADPVDAASACDWGCVATGSTATCDLPDEIAAGGWHTCVVTQPSGRVWCFGLNALGQLGSAASATDVDTPTAILSAGVPLTGALDVCAGLSHTCVALGTDGMTCYGGPFAPSRNYAGYDVVEVACGLLHTCFRTRTGGVSCVGQNGSFGPPVTPTGQLGRPLADGVGPFYATPSDIVVLSEDAVRISVSTLTSCALLTDGTIECWGYDGDGNLGRGGAVVMTGEAPGAVVGGGIFVDLVSTQYATCATTATDLRCWGNALESSVAGAAAGTYRTPQIAAFDFASVGGGGVSERMFGIDATGRLFAWGNEAAGAMARADRRVAGSNATPTESLPLAGGLPLAARRVATNTANSPGGAGRGDHTCVIGSAPTRPLYCWGSNNHGQCGRAAPALMPDALEVTP